MLLDSSASSNGSTQDTKNMHSSERRLARGYQPSNIDKCQALLFSNCMATQNLMYPFAFQENSLATWSRTSRRWAKLHTTAPYSGETIVVLVMSLSQPPQNRKYFKEEHGWVHRWLLSLIDAHQPLQATCCSYRPLLSLLGLVAVLPIGI